MKKILLFILTVSCLPLTLVKAAEFNPADSCVAGTQDDITRVTISDTSKYETLIKESGCFKSWPPDRSGKYDANGNLIDVFKEENQCLIKKAVTTKNVWFCYEVWGFSLTSEQCIVEIAKATNDPNICNKESDLSCSGRANCLSSLAKNNNNAEWCYFHKSDDPKITANCIASLAVKNDNIKLCDSLNENNVYNQKDAEQANSYCMSPEGHQMSCNHTPLSFQDMRDTCVLNFISQTKNYQSCGLITNKEKKEICNNDARRYNIEKYGVADPEKYNAKKQIFNFSLITILLFSLVYFAITKFISSAKNLLSPAIEANIFTVIMAVPFAIGRDVHGIGFMAWLLPYCYLAMCVGSGIYLMNTAFQQWIKEDVRWQTHKKWFYWVVIVYFYLFYTISCFNYSSNVYRDIGEAILTGWTHNLLSIFSLFHPIRFLFWPLLPWTIAPLFYVLMPFAIIYIYYSRKAKKNSQTNQVVFSGRLADRFFDVLLLVGLALLIFTILVPMPNFSM